MHVATVMEYLKAVAAAASPSSHRSMPMDEAVGPANSRKEL
jgi:hypothetical protein